MKRIFLLIVFIFVTAPLFSKEIETTILFEFNKYSIPDSSLFVIAKVLSKNTIERILIEGHCDSVGSKQYNYELSKKRANEVQKLLTQNGIQKSLIKTCIGFGKDKPMNENATELERQLNRRVKITFYTSDEKKEELLVEKTPPQKINISQFKKGEKIVLQNLLFEPGKHILVNKSLPTVNELAKILNTHQSIEIEIIGHVCCTSFEEDGYDWDEGTNNLSETRAREIYYYLIEHGIDKTRLTYKGMGGTQKINADESTEELRAVNRRVEIKILKM